MNQMRFPRIEHIRGRFQQKGYLESLKTSKNVRVEEMLRYSFSKVQRMENVPYHFLINNKKVLMKVVNINAKSYGFFTFVRPLRTSKPRPGEILLPNNLAKYEFEKVCDYLLLVVLDGEQTHNWIIPSVDLDPLKQGIALYPYKDHIYNHMYLEKWEYLSS